MPCSPRYLETSPAITSVNRYDRTACAASRLASLPVDPINHDVSILSGTRRRCWMDNGHSFKQALVANISKHRSKGNPLILSTCWASVHLQDGPIATVSFQVGGQQTIETRCCNGTANSSRLELRRFEGAKELFLDVGASIATPAPVFSYARYAHHHRVALARLRVRCQGCGSFTPSCSISAGQATGCWTLGTQLALAWPEMAIFRFLLCRNSRPIGHAIRIVTQVVLSS